MSVEAEEPPHPRRPGRLALWLLVAVTAIGPTALQIFIPALPSIQDHFGVSPGTAQLVLSVSILAMSISTLLYGPLADRFGRRPVLLGGQGLFLAGSLLCSLAPSLPLLVAGRVVQAMGGASGFILVRTMVSDLYAREETARVLATVTMAMVVGPMLAPAAGAFLTDLAGWRACFSSMAAAGALLLPVLVLRLPETRPARATPPELGALLAGFGLLLRSRRFNGFALAAAFSVCVFFAFISAAPYVMVDVLERPVREYGYYFMMISVSFVAGNLLTRRFARRASLDRMVVAGCSLSVLATLCMAGLLWGGMWSPLAIFLPAAVSGLANGLSMPNAQAGAVSVDPERAGTASGLTGFLQMFLGAVVTQGVGLLQGDTPYTMAGFMLASSVLSLAAILGGRSGHRRTEVRVPSP